MPLHSWAYGIAILVASFAGVGWMRRWSVRKGVLDHPNERSSHKTPVPRGGGAAIVVVVILVLLGWTLASPQAIDLKPIVLLISGALMVAATGWMDDVSSLRALPRLVVQFAAALLAIAAFGYIRHITLPGIAPLHLGMIGFPLTILWIVGLTNAFNFMDGIDGIAGGQAVVAGCGFALAGTMFSQPLVTFAGAVLALSSLGFLFHNWQPARIFMGDTGSGFIGYLLAVLGIADGGSSARLLFGAALFLWPFIFDATFTMIRRLTRGENVMSAHRSHLYQRLVISGLSHAGVSTLYIMLALIGCSMFFTLEAGDASPVLFYIGLPAAAAALWLLTVGAERRARFLQRQREISTLGGLF